VNATTTVYGLEFATTQPDAGLVMKKLAIALQEHVLLSIVQAWPPQKLVSGFEGDSHLPRDSYLAANSP
jgi:hypothetical protein